MNSLGCFSFSSRSGTSDSLAELRDFAEHRQVLVRDLERRRDDQEEKENRLLVDRLEIDALTLSSERDAELRHDERAAVGNRDPATDAGRSEILAPLQHLEQHSFRLVIETKEADQLLEDFILGVALELEFDRVFRKKIA